MSLPVEISPEAERNFAECYNYIHIRNPDGADRWANAFYASLKSLEQNPYRGRAAEDEHHAAELRQVLFKTR